MRRLFVLALLVPACGGSPGRVANPRAEVASFVHERQPLLVATPGVTRIRLDGSDEEQLADGRYHLMSRTRDGRVLVLGDSDTNLYVLDTTAADRKPRRVPELDGRVGSAAVRPDGSIVVASRHADFSLPQSLWATTEDDALYVIDARTLEVEVVPKSRDVLVTRLFWSADGTSLYVGLFDNTTERFDPATRTREPTAWPTQGLAPRGGSTRCERTGATLVERGWRGDEGLDLETPGVGRRRLVTVQGRKRGFHDYQPTISDYFFSASCAYAVFVFDGQTWVVEVQTGRVGHLVSGTDPEPLAGP